MENNNKKTLILSIIGILVLVIAVVGVSFAMFTFTGTGTKENIIRTGSITVDFTDGTKNNAIEITNKYPMDDTTGIAQTDNKSDLTVTANWGTSAMTLNYEMGISNITPGETLSSDYIKIRVLKGSTPVVGTATTGVTISSLATTKGPLNLIDSYYLTGGTMTTSGATDDYTVQAWVADTYDLAVDNANSTSPEVASGTLDNESGTLHKKTTKSETYKFKIKVVAQQA